ncbi:radical SAM protein [Pseudoxanthomonas kalamensis DSM 18571]|uniref:PA0069 family radical SAM protein n=1 Tax=Pseudoxanthomonas kalamensis TaxID=289483 RepID=UPI001390AD7F|nr:PA0069 family radical SAM protein [Pseudoxanthomonas kalamensis]KAF1712677.1 radical SAM protein [Pseudoxanthomonas kalamensis DSM 18571]
MKDAAPPPQRIKGRGASGWIPGRFAKSIGVAIDDGWHQRDTEGEIASSPRTELREEAARSVISRNTSPDIPFSQSVNPYRGCEHGCSYCFARPSHAYLDLSPGLDFETKIFAKTNAPEVLRRELGKRNYVPSPIALGINTDAYQPSERKLGLTRRIIEVLAEARHPFSLITKNALVLRDLDLLADMARQNLVHVYLSITTLDNGLSSRLEPRASAPHSRLKAIHALGEAGVPVGVMFAPAIPWVNDHELEAVLEAAADAGARTAGYVMLRLPHEVAPLFREWLQVNLPDRAAHVMSTIRQSRGGKDYDASFGQRFRGQGVFADLLRKRFALAHRRFGYADRQPQRLDCSRFVAPREASPQGELF